MTTTMTKPILTVVAWLAAVACTPPPRRPTTTALAYDDAYADIQLATAAAIVEAAPVTIFASEATVGTVLGKIEQEPTLRQHYIDGTLVVEEAPYDSAWIRDYGPLMVEGGQGELIDTVYAQGSTTAGGRATEDRRAFGTLGPDADLSAVSTMSMYLALVERMRQRPNDDAFVRWFENTRLQGAGAVQVRHVDTRIDGGNLIRIGTTCLTTDALATDASQESSSIRRAREALACRQLLLLEPLPGQTIKHVDMFVAAGPGRTVLLADYAESSSMLGAQAAMAMSQNARALERAGLRVVRVPAIEPRELDGATYYPTLLNLVAVRRDASRSVVVMPAYPDEDEDVQRQAQAIVRSVFGSGAEIRTVDATVAAHAFGAIHCLTSELPWLGGDGSVRSDRIEIMKVAKREREARDAAHARELEEAEGADGVSLQSVLEIARWRSLDGSVTMWSDGRTLRLCAGGHKFDIGVDTEDVTETDDSASAPIAFADGEAGRVRITADPPRLEIIDDAGESIVTMELDWGVVTSCGADETTDDPLAGAE